MIRLTDGRAGEGLIAVLKLRVTMVKSLITTGGKVDVLVIFRQNLPHVSLVEVTNNNRGCLRMSILKSIYYSV